MPPQRPGPTIPDGSLGDPDSWSGPAPRLSRPTLAQGRPSAVRTAGPGLFTILGGGCALLLVVGALVAVGLYSFTNVGDELFGASPPPPRRPAPTAAPRPSAPRPPSR